MLINLIVVTNYEINKDVEYLFPRDIQMAEMYMKKC